MFFVSHKHHSRGRLGYLSFLQKPNELSASNLGYYSSARLTLKMYSNRLSVAVLVGALAVVMPAFGGSLGELCSGPPASEVVADLCEAQASLESLQIHLQRVADKVVASGKTSVVPNHRGLLRPHARTPCCR